MEVKARIRRAAEGLPSPQPASPQSRIHLSVVAVAREGWPQPSAPAADLLQAVPLASPARYVPIDPAHVRALEARADSEAENLRRIREAIKEGTLPAEMFDQELTAIGREDRELHRLVSLKLAVDNQYDEAVGEGRAQRVSVCRRLTGYTALTRASFLFLLLGSGQGALAAAAPALEEAAFGLSQARQAMVGAAGMLSAALLALARGRG